MQPYQLTHFLTEMIGNAKPSGFDIFFIIVLNFFLIALVKIIFDLLEFIYTRKQPNYKLSAFINYSSMIGLVERFLYIISIWSGKLEFITIVIALKTIVRFPEINKGSKSEITAEKYILGTLLNLLFAYTIVTVLN